MFSRSPGSTQPFDGYTILVVDDEEDSRTFIETVLEDHGATVLTAEHGPAGLELALERRPDLITLDLAMPGMGGDEVFIALRNDPELARTPVCIITGRPEMRRLFYERPAAPPPEGYLDKPVAPDKLVANLRRILEVPKRRAARGDS